MHGVASESKLFSIMLAQVGICGKIAGKQAGRLDDSFIHQLIVSEWLPDAQKMVQSVWNSTAPIHTHTLSSSLHQGADLPPSIIDEPAAVSFLLD